MFPWDPRFPVDGLLPGDFRQTLAVLPSLASSSLSWPVLVCFGSVGDLAGYLSAKSACVKLVQDPRIPSLGPRLLRCL